MNSIAGRPCALRSPTCSSTPHVLASAAPVAAPVVRRHLEPAIHAARAPLDLSQFARQAAAGLVAAAAVATLAVPPVAPPPALANTDNYTIDVRPAERDVESEYFQTAPAELSSADEEKKGPRLGSLIEGPRGKEVQDCTRRCIPTCLRTGQGGPGLGQLAVRKEVVVFKDGYHSRTYCLRECVEVCSLTLNPPAKPQVPTP